MSAASTSNRPRTVEDLIALEAETGERYEIIDGEFVETTVSLKSSNTNSRFNQYLGNFLESSSLGEVFDSELIIELPKSTRHADVSVIFAARLPGDDVDISRFVGAPDVVVEVVSPSDRAKDVNDKVQEWLDSGAQVVWLATPFNRQVTVYRRGVRPRLLTDGDLLDGEDVLPGFSVEVSRLFPSRAGSRAE